MDATRAIRSMLNLLRRSAWCARDPTIVSHLPRYIRRAKTNAASVLTGRHAIVADAVVEPAPLNVINYLLGQTMKLGLLVIIILFQPEIRRLLEQVGSSKLAILFGKRAPDTRINLCINAVVAACAEMAKKRIGAIIVFERDIKLDDTIHTGTRLDAEVSHELLTNIFFPNTPLHDGAVIIETARIVAAGCMRRSAKTNLSRDLGMRHRAASASAGGDGRHRRHRLGGTGSISVAIRGMLKRHLSQDV